MSGDGDITLLQAAGAALHGEHWVTPLAADLNMTRRTMQRMANGTEPVFPDIWDSLLPMITQRKVEITAIEHELREIAARR